jgi:hypothetical protein
MLIAIILIVIVILLWWFGYIGGVSCGSDGRGKEAFRSCNDCIGVMPRDGIAVVNPYVWPYSGISCVDDLYVLNKDTGLGLGFGSGPLTHLSTPDHVELIN